MRILVISDVEGVFGVSNGADFHNSEIIDREAHEVLTTLKKIPGTTLTFCDCHNDGERAEDICKHHLGVQPVKCLWGIDFCVPYDYAVLIGFHSKNGTNDVFSHSFRKEFESVLIDGAEVGELKLIINLLNYHSIKTVFISCNEYALSEIEDIKCIKCVTGKDDYMAFSDSYYCYLRQKLKGAIANAKDSNSGDYIDAEVKVNLEDSRIKRFLESIGYVSVGQYIIYQSTFDFFKALHSFCLDINKFHYIEVVKRYIKKNRLHNASMIPTLAAYFERDVQDLNQNDLVQIIDCLKNQL